MIPSLYNRLYFIIFFREYANAYLNFIEGREYLQERLKTENEIEPRAPKEKLRDYSPGSAHFIKFDHK
jgi:hypothetical protein